MKFAISGLTFKQVLRCITSAQHAFEELEVILAWGSRDRAHCQHLESSAHLPACRSSRSDMTAETATAIHKMRFAFHGKAERGAVIEMAGPLAA